MTKKFSLLLTTILTIFIIGCGKKVDDNSPKKVHWDRDMCERCKMVLSDRDFAVEIINQKNGKVYYFDDIGCATLWLKEEKIPWAKGAKIWVKDSKTHQWIDAKSAKYVDDAVTPMAYGFKAYRKENFPKDKEIIDFENMSKKIEEIEKRNNQHRGFKN